MRKTRKDMEKNNIQHYLIEKHILIETLLDNLISNYFGDSEKTRKEFLFLIMQKENSLYKKIELLEKLKIYENKFISCSKREYKKAIESIKRINTQRNNFAHNFIFTDIKTKKLLINVVKSGNVSQLEINKRFVKRLEKDIHIAISLLAGLNLEIAEHRNLIKDAGELK